ncbi:hypothetical protein WG66_010930 [Moniliophthora roreri]|nr:hypothetical protein WG66_010930 [Moniliophthora roreri]
MLVELVVVNRKGRAALRRIASALTQKFPQFCPTSTASPLWIILLNINVPGRYDVNPIAYPI